MKKLILISILMMMATQSKADCTLQTLNDTDCFQCGENCVAHVTYEDEIQPDGSIKSVGTMTLSGQGAMGDFFHHESIDIYGDNYSRPYAHIRGNIENIKVEEGITSIGLNAFINFDNLKNVELPQSLKNILPGGFQSCQKLNNINIPENLLVIDGQSFEGTSLTSLVIPSQTVLSQSAFYLRNQKTPLTTIYCAPQMRQACEAAIAYRGDAAEVVEYQQTSDNQYLMGGKYYAKLNDIGTPNYIKKRIYTIDEANRVAGKKNRVSIKYR